MKKIIISIIATLMFAIIAPSVLALSPVQSDYYTDVMSGYRYFDAVEFVSGEGIVSGYPDGTYDPEKLLNRAELLKIVIEAEYDDEFEAYSNSSCFDDVEAGEWFTSYVCFAKDEGFVVGYDDNTFRPSDYINLVEAVKISMEVFDYEYLETDPWYKGPVDVAADGNFIPLDFISFDQFMDRGQMADLITRILKSESEELSDYLGMWTPYVVTYENLDSNAKTEPTYCVGDLQYMLVGDSYSPWDGTETCSTCTCQADGTFDCVEEECATTCSYGGEEYDVGDEYPAEDSCNTCECVDDGSGAYTSCTEIYCQDGLLNQVCNALPYEEGDIKDCSTEKEDIYGCAFGSEMTYGDHTFVRCGMWDTVSDDVLLFTGGLGSIGYNLIGDDGEGDLDVITSVEELYAFWGEITDGEDAKAFAMAATFENEAYSEADVEDLYGEDFSFAQDVVLQYSDPVEVQDVEAWHVALYYSPTFGCTPFPVYETVYEVWSDGEIEEFTDKEIGEIDNGLCID